MVGTVAWMGLIPFSTPFSAKIINAPHYGMVKKPTVDLYAETTIPEEHVGVYKAQMYVQDMEASHTTDTSRVH